MVEFFFDCGSPWTYLGFKNIQPIMAEIDEPIVWRPILVGAVFNAVNPWVYENREKPNPVKMRYHDIDLQRWADKSGVKIIFPPTRHPFNSVKVMRGCLWLDTPEKMVPFATRVFEAGFGRDEDISDDAVLARVCKSLEIDFDEFREGIQRQDIKDKLRANTDEVIARGAFGSPTIFVDKDQMFFGNDRLEFVRDAVLRTRQESR